MGFLLKIAIFAVAAYTVWTTVMRWYGALGGKPPAGPVGTPSARPEPQPQYRAQPGRPTIEETRQCPACGTYVSISAAKCGRPDCPNAA